MSHYGNRIACSTPQNLGRVLSVPSEPPFDATLPIHCSQDCFARCPGLSIRQQAQDVVPIRAVCCVTRSHRILPDLNLLLTRRSHQLTQSWCHRRTVCSHLGRPCCPSFRTIVFTRIHVWLRQEFRVNQAQACSHLGLSSQLAVLSTLVPLHQVALFATLSMPSIVEPHLLLP